MWQLPLGDAIWALQGHPKGKRPLCQALARRVVQHKFSEILGRSVRVWAVLQEDQPKTRGAAVSDPWVSFGEKRENLGLVLWARNPWFTPMFVCERESLFYVAGEPGAMFFFPSPRWVNTPCATEQKLVKLVFFCFFFTGQLIMHLHTALGWALPKRLHWVNCPIAQNKSCIWDFSKRFVFYFAMGGGLLWLRPWAGGFPSQDSGH